MPSHSPRFESLPSRASYCKLNNWRGRFWDVKPGEKIGIWVYRYMRRKENPQYVAANPFLLMKKLAQLVMKTCVSSTKGLQPVKNFQPFQIDRTYHYGERKSLHYKKRTRLERFSGLLNRWYRTNSYNSSAGKCRSVFTALLIQNQSECAKAIAELLGLWLLLSFPATAIFTAEDETATCCCRNK